MDQYLVRAQGGVQLNTSSLTVVGVSRNLFSVDNSSMATVLPVTLSSGVFVGVSVATAAAGAAGAAVTAKCLSGTFASGGGCNCDVSLIAGETSRVNEPNCLTQGCVPTGWTCQIVGATGAPCAARAVCSRMQ